MFSPTYIKGTANNAIIADTDGMSIIGWSIIDVRKNKTMANTPGASFPLGTRTVQHVTYHSILIS